MSNSSDDEIPGAAAGAAAASADVEDLTNTDSDDDVPAPHQGGSYVGLGKYALSLRKREAVSHERPASPMVVTPRPPSNSGSGSGSETSPATKKVRRELSLSTSPPSPKARAGGNNALSSLKPLFEVGDAVYAAWWDPDADPRREDRAAWYPGTITSYRVIGTNRFGPVRMYDVEYDDGDELDDLEDHWVFHKRDYELTIKFKDVGKPTGVERRYDPASTDRWARDVGWYAVTVDGTERHFSLLSDAIEAYDACVVQEHGDWTLKDADESSGDGSDLFDSDDDSEDGDRNKTQAAERADIEPSQGEDDAQDSEDPDGLFNSDDESEGRFSLDGGFGRDRGNVYEQAPPYIEPEAILKIKKERASSLVTDAAVVPVMRFEPEYYYLMIVWGKRMLATALPLGDGPPPIRMHNLGREYELVYSELIARKGKGKQEDKMGQRYYKSFYVAVAGVGLEEMDLKLALLSIGDFEGLTYAKGAHKTLSRLKLLVSPSCRPPDGDRIFCIHRLPAEDFEMIEDNGHMGCGFVPRDRLIELLGKSVGAQRAFAVQVRIIGPSSVGICKGFGFGLVGLAWLGLAWP